MADPSGAAAKPAGSAAAAESTAAAAGAPAAAASAASSSSTPAVKVDDSRPADFEGEVQTNDDIPTAEALRKVEDYVVLDRHGQSLRFRDLYEGRDVARRVLVIFVRHFFCGNCQEYLRTLSEAITPEMLLGLPVRTAIAVVGCGDPALIDMYVEATGCPFPIYTDPTRQLFATLGMARTLALGEKPAYTRKTLVRSAMASILQGLRQVKSGLALKGGDQMQVGGEFLFEPLAPAAGAADADAGEKKKITWCHRMRTTRDHAEIPEIMQVLGLEPKES